MHATGRSYADARRFLMESGSEQQPRLGLDLRLSRTEKWLVDAEREIAVADDLYLRQAQWDVLALNYSTLGTQVHGTTERRLCMTAEQWCREQAARIRWEHRMPTLKPNAEIALLDLNTCDACFRPWQVTPTGACPHCPRPMPAATHPEAPVVAPESRSHLDAALAAALRLVTSDDPAACHRGWDTLSSLYTALIGHTADPRVTTMCEIAARWTRRRAATVRWQNHLASHDPEADLALLALGICAQCTRPWQVDTRGACERCPRPLWGPTPNSQEPDQLALLVVAKEVPDSMWAPSDQ